MAAKDKDLLDNKPMNKPATVLVYTVAINVQNVISIGFLMILLFIFTRYSDAIHLYTL